MHCIDCDGPTHVYDSTKYQGLVYRKRKCKVCGRKFCTFEDVISSDDKNFKEAFRLRFINTHKKSK